MSRLLLACTILATVGVALPAAQSLSDIAKKTQEQRDKAKQDASKKQDDANKSEAAKPAAKSFTNADLHASAPPAPSVPADPIADAAEAPKREEALASLRAVQSALDGGANLNEFKKYYLEAKIKVDALRNSPTNAVLKEISDTWGDAVSLKIASITDHMSANEAQYFRTKYGSDADFLSLFREVPQHGFEDLLSSFGKKKAEISAETAGQWCLVLASGKLKAVK